MSDVTITQRDENNAVVATGDYGNFDALVFDAKRSLLDTWHVGHPDLVCIVGSSLLSKATFPILNAMSQANPNSELLAGRLIAQQNKLGGMPTVVAPFFPDGTIWITTMKNISMYWQRGKYRRAVEEESKYNRIATYASSNEGYEIEDYGLSCLIEGITFAEPAAPLAAKD
ncbi:MAG: P2 family phage major capsid protein [Aeromonas sp.]